MNAWLLTQCWNVINAYIEMGDGTGGLKASYCGTGCDNLHPSPAGYQKLVELIAKKLGCI